MRSLLCLFLVFPLAVPAQAPEPSFRTTTSEVLLDLVVRDKGARIIHNLRPEEIQVFENGVPQKLRHFQFIDGRSTTPESPAHIASTNPPSSPALAAPHTVNELRDMSLVSVVIANLDPQGRRLAADALRNFIKNELRPNTYVGVFALGFGVIRVIQPYTNNAEKISTAMDRTARAAMLGQLTSTSQLSMPDTDFGSALNGRAGTAADPNGPGGPTNAVTEGLGSISTELARLMDTSWISEMHDVYADSTNYLMPLRDFVQTQAKIPGRKVLLLFSAGLPVQSDTAEFLRPVISAANRSNVSIYAVDTRGVTTRSYLDDSRRILNAAAQASMQRQLAKENGTSEMVSPTEVLGIEMGVDSIHANTNANLAELAEETGGAMLPDSLDLLEPLQRAMEDVRTHYELTYSSTNSSMDGKFRKIEVRVSRPGARIFSRSGYYAVPVLNGHEIYPFEIASLKALNTTPLPHQFEFGAAALQFRPGTGQSQLDFVFQSPTRDLSIARDGQMVKVHVCVTALIRNDKGQVVEKISKDIPYKVPATKKSELQEGEVSFTAPFLLPPGHYTLETAAVDQLSMRASVSQSTLLVPEDPGFSMSDVAVARRVDALDGPLDDSDPLQARGGKVTPQISKIPSPETAGNVRFYAVAYPPSPVDAPVKATVDILREGKLVMRSPISEVPPDPSGAASILVSLSTAKLLPGPYLAQVSFEYKGQRVKKSVPFTVESGELALPLSMISPSYQRTDERASN